MSTSREQQTGRAGLYGSNIGANMLAAAVAETIGTFVLVYAGTAVAVAALLQRPVAGPGYDSLATPLAFGLALLIVVASIGHVSGGHVNPAVTLGLAATGRFPWRYVPAYLTAQLVGAVLGSLTTWVTLGGAAREDGNRVGVVDRRCGRRHRGMALDGFRPDRYDITGALICLLGVAVIMYAPRGTAG